MSEFDDLIEDDGQMTVDEVIEQAEVDGDTHFLMFEGRLLPIVRPCSESEEQFVQRELEVTRAQMESGRLTEYVDPRTNTLGETRMQRSERYLRWRYAGFRTGQIDELRKETR